jgi:hypothetical protein
MFRVHRTAFRLIVLCKLDFFSGEDEPTWDTEIAEAGSGTTVAFCGSGFTFTEGVFDSNSFDPGIDEDELA